MRGSGWIFAIGATLLWLIVCVAPAVAVIENLIASQPTNVEVRSIWQLFFTSAIWSLGIAIGAIVLGWAPGRVLGRLIGRRGFATAATLTLVPICLPSYLVFYAWWQSWPPDSVVYQWALEHNFVRELRLATLAAGFLCWSWPIVVLCVAGVVAATPAQQSELAKLDGASLLRRVAGAVRTDARGLVLGALLVFLIVFNNTTCFDLAEVFTFSNEVRAIEALGANAAQVVLVAAPAGGVAAIGALIVWMLLAGRSQAPAERVSRSSSFAKVLVAAIWIVSVLLPLSMFAWHIIASHSLRAAVSEFVRLYGGSLLTTCGLALCTGFIGAMLAVGMAGMWSSHRPLVRGVAHLQAVVWVLLGLLPATVTAMAIASAFNRSTPLDAFVGGHEAAGGGLLSNWVYSTPAIIVIGHLACFGFVAALLGRWIVGQRPREIREVALLDGATNVRGFIAACRPQIIAAFIATLALMFVLSVGEIPVTARLTPPMRAGWGPLATSMLNDMHYQRPQTVMTAAVVIVALAFAAALCVALATMSLQRFRRTVAVVMIVAMILPTASCQRSDDGGAPEPVDTIRLFGSAGLGKTQFNYPRAIDADPANGWIYIIDKSARVQKLSPDGEHVSEWTMPEFENGKPVGVSVGPPPDNRVFVPDTHYHRIMIYSPEGEELARFGSYGDGPGQFIYPTDVAFGPEGRLYVSEYGGNDRIQVFDADGKYLFEFGSFGSEAGQFNRPESMAFNENRTELFIADACNHRIVVTDPQGKVLRTFGSPGRERGRLAYPYGLAVLRDGTIMVSEFGNNRIQQFDPSGRSLGVWGRIGRGEGDVQYPWGVAELGREIFVLDSGNNRVQVMREP